MFRSTSPVRASRLLATICFAITVTPAGCANRDRADVNGTIVHITAGPDGELYSIGFGRSTYRNLDDFEQAFLLSAAA